jgi:ATP/maltotriose-dependent transcriptional regulator MalT
MSPRAGFVGRQRELSVLNEQLNTARTGHPQVVFVEAEPGAGKSTLLAHFVGSLADAAVLQASGDEAEVLLSYGVIDQLGDDLPTEPGADPMAVGARLVALLDRLQDDGQVVVIVLDDLHWFDRPSSRAVLFALRRLRRDKVLTIVATRADDLSDPGWWRFVNGDPRVTRLRLGGLGPADLIEMARALGSTPLSTRGAARLADHTDGNPLYCRALLEEIGVTGLNEPGEGGLPAPRMLSAVILTRVAALPIATQSFLAAASVLGQHAAVSTTASVAGLTDGRPALDDAVKAGLVGDAPGNELTFTHPLYRAAIYGDLSPTNRRDLHARAAQLVAGHVRLTHRVAAAAGPDEMLAADLMVSAAASASVGDVGTSAWAMEQAADLSSDPTDRERRLLDAAVAHLNAADTSSAARVLAACQGQSARRDALTGLLGVFMGSPTAGDRLRTSWQTHDPESEREIGARAATSLANWMVISGRSDEALIWAERAVDSTVDGSALRAMARTAQAYALGTAGRGNEGLAALEFLPTSANDVPMVELDALIVRGMVKVYVDDLAGAIADLGVAASRMRTGLPASYPGPCLSHLSDAHFRRGDWDAAATFAQLATALAQDTDRPLDLARAHGRSAQILAFRGQWEAGESHVSAGRAAVERIPVVLAVAAMAVAEVALATARADPNGVLRATEAVRAGGILEVGGRPGIFNWRAMEAQALTDLGHLDDAESALEEFEAAIPAAGLASATLALTRCRANLAHARGHAARAEEAFAEAHRMEAGVPMPFDHALVSLDDGRRLRTVGNRPVAVTQFQRAHRIFSGLGADPYVEVCAAELAALEVTTSAESRGSALGLSRAELAVARLVARGLTNREVASTLFVSVKTVEYHLRNCYIKLDITSRKALTGLLA